MTTRNQIDITLSGQSGTGSIAGTTSPSFTTPVLGTPTSGTLTNCTGLPIAGITGLGTGVATALAANVTGSGGIALATSPVFVTPALGTPASGTLTNCTGLPIAGTTGYGTGVATALAANVNGTGAISLTTNASFVTPTLGAASATSINFGGSTLSNYVALTAWTPTLSFATAGDLSVAYVTQTGFYLRIGNLVLYSFALTATPTYTTASGSVQIGGLPFTTASSVNYLGSMFFFSTPTWPAGRTSIALYGPLSSAFLQIIASGSAVSDSLFTTTQFPTTVQQNFGGTILVTV
jgi:hypothetical protein